MSKKCSLTGKSAMFGHNVSHANNRTKRRFDINLQNISYDSFVFGKLKLRLPVSTHRSVIKKGGIDMFLLKTDSKNLTAEAISLKKIVMKHKDKILLS